MKQEINTSLKELNTFHIDVKASKLITIESEDELLKLLATNEPIKIIGGGSNILFTKNVDETLVRNQLKGIEIISENENSVDVKFASGEVWHQSVLWAVQNNFAGIENLSLIPGSIGAAPIQNIGAYGVELKDVFVDLEAIHLKTLDKKIFSKEVCNFGYRDSIFKHQSKGSYFITSVTLRLSKKHHLRLDYGTIKDELASKGIEEPTIKDVSDAVISIRSSKLPNPDEIGNAGSFFKNPVIEKNHFEELKLKYETIPSFPAGEHVKIPAAWLIEQCNWKGYKEGNFGVHAKQALVLVNYSNANGNDILELSDRIITSVQHAFNILLEREVNIW